MSNFLVLSPPDTVGKTISSSETQKLPTAKLPMFYILTFTKLLTVSAEANLHWGGFLLFMLVKVSPSWQGMILFKLYPTKLDYCRSNKVISM